MLAANSTSSNSTLKPLHRSETVLQGIQVEASGPCAAVAVPWEEM
jgi:hypothetical protein